MLTVSNKRYAVTENESTSDQSESVLKLRGTAHDVIRIVLERAFYL